MKKVLYVIPVILVIVVGAMIFRNHKQVENQDADIICKNSMTTGSANSCDYDIKVVLNRKSIEDMETCAEEIVSRFRENHIPGMLFSFDQKPPTTLRCTVYTSEDDLKNGKVAFGFICECEDAITEGYNILNHYDKYHIEVNESN